MKLFIAACPLFLALLTISASSFAADGDDAKFGLKWGMTPTDVKALGTTPIKTKGDRNLEIYTTSSVPKNWEYQNFCV